MGIAETARLVAELSLDAKKFTAGFKAATGSVDKLERRLGKLGGITSRGIGKTVQNIERLGMVAAGAGVAGVVKATQAAGDFEAALNTINTVAQTTPEGLAAIGEGIRKIARDTGTSVDDLGQAYYDLVSAGIKTADAQNVLTQANTLAIGGLSTTAEAVDLLTTAINSYGGDATKAATYANMFAQAIGAGKVTASELAASFATVGPIAAEFGVGIDQISAAIGVMTAKGTPAAQAFTQIRAAIVALKKPNTAMASLQKDLGVNFAKIAKNKGLAAAYQRIAKEAAKAGIPIEKLTGRIEGAQYAAQVTGDSFDGYNAELERVRDSSEGAGVAQEQMSQRTKGFNFAMQRLKANVHDAAITIGSELLPHFADLAGEATAWLTGHQGEIKTFAKELAGGIRDAVTWAKSLNWDKIADALRAAAGFAKGLVSAFTNMPAEAQGTILALLGLNKLSGGAVTGIVGELGKGLIKGVLGMTAGVVNITAGVVKGGGTVGPVKGGGTPVAPVAAGGLRAGLAALGGIAGFTAIAGAAAIALYYGVPGLVGSKPAKGQGDAEPIYTKGGGTITGANAGMIRLYTPGLRALGQAASATAGKLDKFGRVVPNAVPQKGTVANDPTGFLNSGAMQTLAKTAGDTVAEQRATTQAVAEVKTKQAESLVAFRAGERTSATGLANAATAARTAGVNGAVATNAAAGRVAGAIAANRPIVTTNVQVHVTAASVSKSVSVQSRAGSANGSAGSGTHPGGGGP